MYINHFCPHGNLPMVVMTAQNIPIIKYQGFKTRSTILLVPRYLIPDVLLCSGACDAQTYRISLQKVFNGCFQN